jgi:hypothetical protein
MKISKPLNNILLVIGFITSQSLCATPIHYAAASTDVLLTNFVCYCTENPASTFTMDAVSHEAAINSYIQFCSGQYGTTPAGTPVVNCTP